MFDDLLAANRSYAAAYPWAGLEPGAARGLAVVTCMDTRIEPLGMLGLEPGDAKIIRNAGARVTDDVLRSLVLAVNLLGVERVAVVQHTGCKMIGASNDQLRATIAEAQGADANAWDFLPIDDQDRVLNADIERIRACALLPSDLPVGGFVYDVDTGRLDARAGIGI